MLFRSSRCRSNRWRSQWCCKFISRVWFWYLNNSHNSASKMLAEEANNKADAEGAEGDPEVLHRRKELGDDDDGADNGVRF